MRSSTLHIALSVLLCGILLCIGWLTQRFSIAVDITDNSRHSLSSTTQDVLKAIEKPVEIIAVLGPNPQQHEAVSTLVSRFQKFKPDLQLRFINPETDPAAARSLNAAPGGELILRTEGREQRLQSLSERSLVNSLRQLNQDRDRDIVFITGHDERSPTRISNEDWSTTTARLAKVGLATREVSLVSDPRLSDNIDLVVLAAPRRPYFPGEIASLNDYLYRGGNLLWLNEAQEGTASDPGLQILNDYLGVDTLPGTVIDSASQTLKADSPDFVLLDRFPKHPITLSLTSPVLLPQVTALAVTPMAGQTVLPLLQTPESSWTESGRLEGAIQFDENTQEVAGPLLLGVTIERELPQGMQRMAVIGDADLGASRFIDNGANQAFIESLMLWLSGDADALSFVTQKAADSELLLSRQGIIGLSAAYLAGIPALLFMTAALIFWRRRAA